MLDYDYEVGFAANPVLGFSLGFCGLEKCLGEEVY